MAKQELFGATPNTKLGAVTKQQYPPEEKKFTSVKQSEEKGFTDQKPDTSIPADGSKKRKVKHEYTERPDDGARFIEAYTAGAGSDPGIPPTWQSWYGTMPHLDIKSAYKKDGRKEERKAKLRKVEEAKAVDSNKDLLEMDMEALSKEMERATKDAADQDALCKEYTEKIAKAEEHDKKEQARAVDTTTAVERASYKFGMVEGKLRSSEIYFAFIGEETNRNFAQKKLALTRSCNLMLGEIAHLKTDVRDLLVISRKQQAAERQAAKDAKA